MSTALLLTSARPFGADTLACALTLTGKPAPTADELAAALGEMYPAGNGPVVPDLLAADWLVPTIDGRGLRVPPLPLAEQDARLAEAGPELILKLNTTPPAPLNGQGARLATANPVKSTELAAHESKTALVPAGVKNPGGGNPPAASPLKMSYYKGPINNKRPHANITPSQLHQVITQPPRYLRELAAATRAAFAAHGKKHPAYIALKTQHDYFTAAGTFPPRPPASCRYSYLFGAADIRL